jgi:hypothetical protein
MTLSIISSALKDFLVDVTHEFGSHWDDKHIETQFAPTECNMWRLIWCWKLLLERQDDLPRSKAQQELKLLIDFIRQHKPLEEIIQRTEDCKAHRTVLFTELWTIFPPGELVFVSSATQLQVILVNSVSYGARMGRHGSGSEFTDLELSCCYYGEFDHCRSSLHPKQISLLIIQV